MRLEVFLTDLFLAGYGPNEPFAHIIHRSRGGNMVVHFHHVGGFEPTLNKTALGLGSPPHSKLNRMTTSTSPVSHDSSRESLQVLIMFAGLSASVHAGDLGMRVGSTKLVLNANPCLQCVGGVSNPRNLSVASVLGEDRVGIIITGTAFSNGKEVWPLRREDVEAGCQLHQP